MNLWIFFLLMFLFFLLGASVVIWAYYRQKCSDEGLQKALESKHGLTQLHQSHGKRAKKKVVAENRKELITQFLYWMVNSFDKFFVYSAILIGVALIWGLYEGKLPSHWILTMALVVLFVILSIVLKTLKEYWFPELSRKLEANKEDAFPLP